MSDSDMDDSDLNASQPEAVFENPSQQENLIKS